MSAVSDIHAGLMSGTSMDAVDGCLADFSTHPPTVLATASLGLDDLRPALRALATGDYPTGHDPLLLMGEIDHALGHRFADCVERLLDKAGLPATRVRAIGSHGQTIRHCPAAPSPFTLQIGDPNLIAQRTGITVVADFRRRDMAAGGQGAPLVPPAHQALFAEAGEALLVVNLGGIGNVSRIYPDGRLAGFDTGPANTLMDAWTRRHRGEPMDRDGAWARSGRKIPALLAALRREPWFSQPPPKSTGPELFNLEWLAERANAAGLALESLRPEDAQATLLALTVETVVAANLDFLREARPRRVIVVGGGCRNGALMAALTRAVAEESPDTAVTSSQDHGIDPQWIECLAFGWLARQTLAGRAGNAPAVTGASTPVILGGIYPANP